MMKAMLGAAMFTAAILAGTPTFAQSFNVTGVGDARAQNQPSTVGLGSTEGYRGRRYGMRGYGYGARHYGRSVYRNRYYRSRPAY